MGLDSHVCRHGLAVYPSASASPEIGYEARDPVAQPPGSSGSEKLEGGW